MKKRNNPKVESMKERSLIVENERKNLHTPKYYLNEEQDFSEYMRYVNVIGRSIAKEISGDDDAMYNELTPAMYNELTPKIENWFMNNVNKISDMGDAATEHIIQKSK
jgi:regulatory protein YycH of two-component signal transduction system YycFG